MTKEKEITLYTTTPYDTYLLLESRQAQFLFENLFTINDILVPEIIDKKFNELKDKLQVDLESSMFVLEFMKKFLSLYGLYSQGNEELENKCKQLSNRLLMESKYDFNEYEYLAMFTHLNSENKSKICGITYKLKEARNG